MAAVTIMYQKAPAPGPKAGKRWRQKDKEKKVQNDKIIPVFSC